jgi:hypothetical protein
VGDRDLSDAEVSLLETTRGRIGELDGPIAQLEAIENLRAQHRDGAPRATPDARETRALSGDDQAPVYRTAGEYVVDLCRARGLFGNDRDADAERRIVQARQANQTTTDTPGILPTPIVGQVVSLIDANRPFITSLGGAKGMGSIPGKTFSRPKVTQHTIAGAQSAELATLPTQKMTISGINFTKTTYGGTVEISRQDIDWTQPSAWDILIRDLADVYAVASETAAATAFDTAATGVGGNIAVGAVLKDWADALYTAAMHSYQAGKRMPTRVWCSLDVWAALGALVDVARPSFPMTGNLDTAAGSASLADFRGDVLGLPRIVVPTFPAQTCIVGPDALFEVYEEVVGLLSQVTPANFGVVVAYGGDVAFGALDGASFVKLTIAAGATPTMQDAEAMASDAATADDATKAEQAAKSAK